MLDTFFGSIFVDTSAKESKKILGCLVWFILTASMLTSLVTSLNVEETAPFIGKAITFLYFAAIIFPAVAKLQQLVLKLLKD